MEPSPGVEIRVGIFVAIAIALTVTFIIVLGGERAVFHKTYALKMEVGETGGLAVGSIVQVAGVPCGNVSRVAFDNSSNKVDVYLKIDRQFQDRITEGSVAGIHTQGALGDKFVMIQPGQFGGTPLPDGATIEAAPETDLLTTLGKSGNKVEKAFQILDNIDRIVKGLTERNFSQNMADTVRNLKGATQSLDQIMASVKGSDPKHNSLKKALDHLSSVMEKIDDGQGTLGGLINDPTVHEDLKTILGGAKRSKLLKYLIRQTIKNSDEGKEQQAK